MVNASAKLPKISAWDRRPWPSIGDNDVGTTYYSVGLFLSQWERYEAALSVLFSSFVGGETKAARRAYVAVRTFEGRAEMLRAASSAHFDEKPDAELQAAFKAVLSAATCYSPRRNDIAHGVANYFSTKTDFGTPNRNSSFALYPSQASFKEREVNDVPSYCMTSVEITYFFERLFELQRPAMDLAVALVKKTRLASLRKLYEPALRSASRLAGQNTLTEGEPPPQSSAD